MTSPPFAEVSMHEQESRGSPTIPGRRQPIRVCIIDPNCLECEGLVALLNASKEFKCVGAWTDLPRALKLMPEAAPNIILLDTRLPGNGCLEVLQTLRAIVPYCRVLCMLDCYEGPCSPFSPPPHCSCRAPAYRMPHELDPAQDCFQIAIKSGARGVVRKQASFHQLVQAMTAVAAGELWMEKETATGLVEQYLAFLRLDPSHIQEHTILTARERQIEELIARGLSNKEITAQLNLAYPTVKNCVSSILRKLDLGDRTQIALHAVRGAGQAAPAQFSGNE